MATQCRNGKHREHDVYAALCPCREILEVLANKWSALAIGALEDGPLRFKALERRLEGVGPKTLTRTLRKLEDFGMLTRTVYPDVPVRVQYELTALGTGVAVPLAALADWVEAHADRIRPEPIETQVSVGVLVGG